MYRLIVNNIEMRQSTDLTALESLIERLPRLLWTIQTFTPGLGWRDLDLFQ
jgi:hypothetical protein